MKAGSNIAGGYLLEKMPDTSRATLATDIGHVDGGSTQTRRLSRDSTLKRHLFRKFVQIIANCVLQNEVGVVLPARIPSGPESENFSVGTLGDRNTSFQNLVKLCGIHQV